jgi:hypothetical protein
LRLRYGQPQFRPPGQLNEAATGRRLFY